MNNAEQRPRRQFIPPTEEEIERQIDRDLAIAGRELNVNVAYARRLIFVEKLDREVVFHALMMRANEADTGNERYRVHANDHHAATLYMSLAEGRTQNNNR